MGESSAAGSRFPPSTARGAWHAGPRAMPQTRKGGLIDHRALLPRLRPRRTRASTSLRSSSVRSSRSLRPHRHMLSVLVAGAEHCRCSGLHALDGRPSVLHSFGLLTPTTASCSGFARTSTSWSLLLQYIAFPPSSCIDLVPRAFSQKPQDYVDAFLYARV